MTAYILKPKRGRMADQRELTIRGVYVAYSIKQYASVDAGKAIYSHGRNGFMDECQK